MQIKVLRVLGVLLLLSPSLPAQIRKQTSPTASPTPQRRRYKMNDLAAPPSASYQRWLETAGLLGLAIFTSGGGLYYSSPGATFIYRKGSGQGRQGGRK